MNRSLLALSAVLTAGLAAGCAGDGRLSPAAAVPPAPAELPRFEHLERRGSATVAVEDPSGSFTRVRIVPEFKEVKPTPQEQQILGFQEPPKDDFAILYRPPPTPERGIDPIESGLKTGTYGLGGADARAYGEVSTILIYGWGGASTAVYPLAARMADVWWPREPTANIGGRDEILTGVDQKRTVAGKHARLNE